MGIIACHRSALAAALVVVAALPGPAAAAPASGPHPADEVVQREAERKRDARQREDSAAERDRRRVSRRAFRALSRDEALDVLARWHPAAVLLPAWRAPHVPEGHRIVGYDDEFTARLEAGDGATGRVVTSNVPLLASDASGRARPVDLSLERTPAGFRAINPLADIALGNRLEEGMRLSGPGVSVRPVTEHDEEPARSGDTLLYANAMTDSDVLVRPTAMGFAVHLHLRSEESPERFAMDLEVPEGAKLYPIRAHAAIEVRRGDAVLAVITAPIAWDADARPVELTWDIVDDRLVIAVPHRDRDYAYPLLVDPEVVETFEWERYGMDGGYGGIQGWKFRGSGPFTPAADGSNVHAWSGNSTWLGNGLYIRNLGTTYYYGAGDSGVWWWRAPGFARLHRVEWNLFDQDAVDGTCTELGIAKWGPYSAGPTSWQVNNPSWLHCGTYYGQYANSYAPGEPGDEAEFKVIAANWAGYRRYFAAQVGVVYLHMSDPDVPVLGSGLPDAWVNWEPTKKLDVWALDVSLGVRHLTLTSGQWSRTIGPDTYTRCQRTYVCPRGQATDGASYSAAVGDLPEGINDIAVIATDPAGNAWRSDQVTLLSGQGLRGQYYDNADFTAGKFARLDPQIDFNWGTGSPDSRIGADTFTIRWSGYVDAPEAGTYTFQTSADDGVRLWVGDLNNPIIDDWRLHAEEARNGSKYLERGKHRIVMEYVEEGGGAVARLRWKPPTASSFVVIPANRLSPPGGWKLKLDRSPPDIATPVGALYDRRNREDDKRFQGLYESSYSVSVSATDGSTTSNGTQRSGVRTIDFEVANSSGVVVQRSLDPAPQSCSSSCPKTRPWTFDADSVPDGVYTVRAIAKDQLGHSRTRTWDVTVDRRGDIYRGRLVTTDPEAGGTVYRTEWLRLNSRDVRAQASDVTETRTTAPCRQSGVAPLCGEVRIGAAGTFSSRQGTAPDDPRLPAISDFYGPGVLDGGVVEGTGQLSPILQTWQRVPPASGVEYTRYRVVDELGTQRTYWVESATKLPVRVDVLQPDGTTRTGYVVYDIDRKTSAEVAPDFFLPSVPADASSSTETTLVGAAPVGPLTDPDAGGTFSSYFLGNSAIIGLSFDVCLLTSDIVKRAFDASQDVMTVVEGETADPSGPSAVSNAYYARGLCAPGAGAPSDNTLLVATTAGASRTGRAWKGWFTTTADEIESDPTDEDLPRGGRVPVVVAGTATTAYAAPLDDTRIGFLVEIGPAVVQVLGTFAKADIPSIAANLQTH